MKFHSRIAIFSYHTCPLASTEGKETGGMNVYVLELTKELGRVGLLIDIFTRSQDTTQPKLVNISDNVRLMHVLAGPERPYPKKQLRNFIPEFVNNVSSFIEANNLNYKLYHAHYYLSGLAAIALNKKMAERKPLFMTFHTLALIKNLVARTGQEKDGKFRIDSEIALVKAANKIIVPSQNERSYLKYLYGCPVNKIAVITPGIDTKLFRPIPIRTARKKIGAGYEHKIILFVGRIEPLKGIDVLLYALKILLERNPKLKLYLWIVGGDVSQKKNLWSGELKKLEALRKLLHIETIVRFVGQQPQEQLPYYYNASDVVVMPSHYESFGMVALEAMACGVPVVATNVSGVTGLIDSLEEKLVSSANNPLLLASQIEWLLTDKKWHQKLSRELLNKVKSLTWEQTAEDTIKIYQAK